MSVDVFSLDSYRLVWTRMGFIFIGSMIYVLWYSLHIHLVACLMVSVSSMPYMYAKGYEVYVSLDVCFAFFY